MRLLSYAAALTGLVALANPGCATKEQNIGSGDPMATGGGKSIPAGPASKVTATEAVPAPLQQALETAQAMNGTALTAAYPPPATAALTYDPRTAAGMELIQASPLALNENELAVLGGNGLVISKRTEFPSFAYGYKSIYAADLPVYVSADSILEAVHRTFDSLLMQNEQLVLISELGAMLGGMRNRLADASFDESVKRDIDLYLTVAASLLAGQELAPAGFAPASDISALFALANTAQGHRTVELFGVDREEDFSQFVPRGHYVNSDELKRYFKATMWLGRVDFRLIETQSDGSQVFYRRQFDSAVALRELLGESEFALWQHIDDTIGAYAGEHDSMTPKMLDGMMSALHVSSLSEANGLSDQQIVDEIARGGWGAQRIASRILYKDPSLTKTFPLDRSFLLFGQRYTVDSHTFVNVTYDRVANRMMPEPLDAAFAALGNNAALPILSDEFANISYVAGLAKTRALVDAHEPGYWEGSLYTRWLGALRSLSPQENSALPSVTRTPAWQKRILSAQLGSWAELRRDTILYVKQSYTTGNLCEFPDAYVDPYPEFYARLGTLAEAINVQAQQLPASVATLKESTQAWVANFKAVTANLQKMAEDQLSGTPHSADLMAFINDAVKWDEQNMCGEIYRTNLTGWYLKLFLTPQRGTEYDPVVADVHTQPTDEAGADVGRILHVGTGAPRLMIVTAETCQGPRAYAGLAFSYGELVTEQWKRLNDQDWADKLAKEPFPDATWMSSVLAE